MSAPEGVAEAPAPAGTVESPRGAGATREMTYLEAISDALREEMRADETVFVLGEDVGAFGGAFKVTDGFAEEFGAARVMDALPQMSVETAGRRAA